ncbi:putative condensin-2 complex subunit D3-like [Apostichopus japonicus]|uniref:Putative condensin-2 complex subunit D3-like n=1 Tax=Stichopus japonicus TaxID=307972 RepID=A0A2G8KAQ5_STIJA|nr:putative condensin-2 complex subunit D3-like [Apostichopus japonicus]
MACRRNKIAEALSGTMIADVCAEWVSNVWEEDFTQLPQVPQVLEDLTGDTMNLGKNLKMTIRELSMASEEGSDQSEFWKILTEQNLKPKALVACLYYFMQRVDQYVSPAEEREVAILAAHLYFAMIGVPGSGAYSIIHPVVFEEAVDIFKLLPSSDGVESAKRKRVTSQSQGSKAPRLNQRQKQVVGFDEDSDEEEDDVTALTPQETRHLRSCLLEMLKELVRLILKKSVNDNEQMLNQLVSRLVELTKSTEQHNVDFESRDVASVSSFTQGAFMGLKCLGSTHHTEGSDKMPPLTLVFKYLMPSLLMLMGENEGVAANNIPQQIQRIKQTAVEFVCHMISHMGEKSFGSVRVLLQHMCVTVPEKAEYRTLVGREVVKILQGLPEVAQESFMQWLCKYSQNVKIGYRVFALEVVTILMEPTGADPNVTPIPAGSSNLFLSQKSLLAMLIGRCSDRAPTVRAKALTCLGQFTSNDSPHIALALQELFLNPTSPGSDGNGQRQETEGSSSEIAMDTGEGGTNKDGATPGNLAGGSPLLLLNMSNGGQGYDLQGFLAMVKQRAGDEKVGVRKAALQVLENVSQIDKSKLDEGSLQVIQERCRDPALSVRKQAMVSCTNLLMKHATNESLQRYSIHSANMSLKAFDRGSLKAFDRGSLKAFYCGSLKGFERGLNQLSTRPDRNCK